MKKSSVYFEIYQLLHGYFGPQGWWPAQSPFEVIVGAILTQNTNWSNVSKAIANLKDAAVLQYDTMKRLSVDEIAGLIRPSGYYNLKAKRLRSFFDMIEAVYSGELDFFLEDGLDSSRENLLAVKGIGQETADSILLYACGHTIFVVDAYTHRIFSRHNLVDEVTDYTSIQQLFTDSLPADNQVFNEYHALIVKVASLYCKKNNPRCADCPLQGINV